MTQTRDFALGAVLSVTTGKLLAPLGEVYEILSFMTGQDIFTHQIPRAMRACRPSMIGQHPQFADLDASEVHDKATADKWLRRQVKTFGATLPVEPLKPTAYEPMDPIAEAEAMVGKDRVIVVREG